MFADIIFSLSPSNFKAFSSGGLPMHRVMIKYACDVVLPQDQMLFIVELLHCPNSYQRIRSPAFYVENQELAGLADLSLADCHSLRSSGFFLAVVGNDDSTLVFSFLVDAFHENCDHPTVVFSWDSLSACVDCGNRRLAAPARTYVARGAEEYAFARIVSSVIDDVLEL